MLPAVVNVVDHKFVVEVAIQGSTRQLSVDSDQAWDFDLERGLNVMICARRAYNRVCLILRRTGNKKFVRIGSKT